MMPMSGSEGPWFGPSWREEVVDVDELARCADVELVVLESAEYCE